MHIRKKLSKLLKSRHIRSGVVSRNRWNLATFSASLCSLSLLIGVLVFILCSIMMSGYHSMTVAKILVPIGDLSSYQLPADDLQTLQKECEKILNSALEFEIPLTVEPGSDKRVVGQILSYAARDELLSIILRSGSEPLEQNMWFSASNDIDMLYKGMIGESVYSGLLDKLREEERISLFFNKSLFTKSDSLILEDAGIKGAFIGSLLTVLVCVLVAVPIGILSGICLQEFMPKNILTHILEISVNNLSAVPSIIFGILGLAVYLSVLDMPRSSSLVGGLTLSLMMIPNIIIATKSAFASVPSSVKDAALALGASHSQVVLHHSLSMAIPGIIQGFLLSLARILGESSPLLMIGMVAFIVDVPKGFTDPATVLPIQIYMWSSNPDVGFTGLAAIAIVALLVVMLLLNICVSFIRRKFDQFMF